MCPSEKYVRKLFHILDVLIFVFHTIKVTRYKIRTKKCKIFLQFKPLAVITEGYRRKLVLGLGLRC